MGCRSDYRRRPVPPNGDGGGFCSVSSWVRAVHHDSLPCIMRRLSATCTLSRTGCDVPWDELQARVLKGLIST